MRHFKLCLILLLTAVLLCACQSTPDASSADIAACIASSEVSLFGVPVCSKDDIRPLKEARKVSETLPNLRSASENSDLYHEVPLAQNERTPTYYLPLDTENSDWDSITLTSGTALFFVSDDPLPEKADALKNGYTFSLFICGEQFYSEAKLVCTGLPMLKIDLYDRSGAVAGTEIQRSPASRMQFSYYDACDPVTGTVASAGCFGTIHTRGGTSAKYEKHSFKFSLYDDVSCTDQNNLALCGLRRDDDWVLNAMYQEETKVRDMLAYSLWEDIGADHYGDGTVLGTRMRYVEVILGGKYWGLYGLCEPEDAKQFGISETEPGSVLKASSWVVPRVSELRNAIINDLGQVAEVEVKYPDLSPETSHDAWKPFLDYIEITYESSDFYFEQQIGNVMDESNLADLYIFLNVTAGRDNTFKNLYLSCRRDVGQLVISPWDCDISFGLNWGENSDLHLYHEPDTFTEILSLQVHRRYLELNVNDFRQTLYDRWQKLREDWLSAEEILSRAHAFRAQLEDSGALNRNRKKWKNSGDAADISYIEEFVNFRIPFLDEYFESLIRQP